MKSPNGFIPDEELPINLSEEEKERRRRLVSDRIYFGVRGRLRDRSKGRSIKKGRRTALTTSALIKRTAVTSGYDEADVKDLLRHVIAHIQHALLEPIGSVRLEGIGIIQRLNEKKPRGFISYVTGKREFNQGASVLHIKADGRLRSLLNENYENEIRYAEDPTHIPPAPLHHFVALRNALDKKIYEVKDKEILQKLDHEIMKKFLRKETSKSLDERLETYRQFVDFENEYNDEDLVFISRDDSRVEPETTEPENREEEDYGV